MSKVTLITNTRTLLLAQFVNRSRALIVAIERHANATVPVEVYHLKSFGVPDVRLGPSKSALTDFIEVE